MHEPDVLKRFAVRLSQHRQQHFVVQQRIPGMPVDVEHVAVRARSAKAQHVLPPNVLRPIAMWLGTISTISPRCSARSAAIMRRNPSSPPSSGFTRVGSTTSYPCIDPARAVRIGDA